MSSGKEEIEPRLLTLKDRSGKSCPLVLRDIIKLVKLKCSEYRDGEFDWDETEKAILIVVEEIKCVKNGDELRRLVEELKAPIESRLDILDL